MSKWFKLSFVLTLILVVLPVAGCLKGPTPLTEGDFRKLLTLRDIQKLSTPSDIILTSNFRNIKTDPAVDPSQLEHITSFYGMVFVSDDETSGVSLTLIAFDSAEAMKENMPDVLANPQLQPMAKPIGTSSVEQELNTQGLGSVIVFQQGNTLVELLTGVPEGADPFLTIENLETLARQIAAKL